MANQADIIAGEEWRDVPSFPGYQASSLGRVRRLPYEREEPNHFYPGTTCIRKYKGHLCKPRISPFGYVTVHARKSYGGAPVFAHVMVCEAFHGTRPAPHYQVAHGDAIKTNNVPQNLRWATATENNQDRVRHGTSGRGSQSVFARITESDVVDIRKQIAAGRCRKVMARTYGLSRSSIDAIHTRRNWSHVA